MAEKKMQHFRIPAEVLAAARARAEREHRTLTDVVVQALLAYGSSEAPGARTGKDHA